MTVAEYNFCVNRFADRLYRFILKNLTDEDKAKDIVQDSYEKLWIKHDEVSFEKAKSYLFATAYHTMIDRIRKDKRMENADMPTDEHLYDSTYHTDLPVEQTGLKELLNRALDKLPEIQKSVILLRDYEGYSYSEISQITGLTESQVKVYIYRGRIFLKKFIGSIETVI